MGFGGISMGSLLLIFLIVLVLFGTKKLRNIGEDLGHAFRSFRKGLEGSDPKTTGGTPTDPNATTMGSDPKTTIDSDPNKLS